MFLPSQKISISFTCSPQDALRLYAEIREWAEPKLAELGGGSIAVTTYDGEEIEAATPAAA